MTGELSSRFGTTHTEESKAKISAALSGERCPTTKLKEAEVLQIRELWATGNYTQRELASKFGVNHRTISAIITRKTWKHS